MGAAKNASNQLESARKTSAWVRKKIGVKEEDGLHVLENVKESRKYEHWKRRPDGLVIATIEAKCKEKRRKVEGYEVGSRTSRHGRLVDYKEVDEWRVEENGRRWAGDGRCLTTD